MKYSLAPMEGITGYVYRNALHQVFPYTDRYMTPFITPNQNRKLTSRELNDVLPEHNQGLSVIPQIMTNKADDFIWAAGKMKELGYREVNLNLGCPSPTVVTKGRGAGFLDRQAALDQFLDQVCNALTGMEMVLSIKTRLGMTDPEEFYELIQIFNRYPLSELIIHPRVRTDYYNHQPNLVLFRDGIRLSRNPVCYNGDLFHTEGLHKFMTEFPAVDSVMLGRGIIANPGLLQEIKEGRALDKPQLLTFHDTLLHGYQEVISGDRNVLFKMKELWHYMGALFDDSDKQIKKIKKAGKIEEYKAAVSALLAEREIKTHPGFTGWR